MAVPLRLAVPLSIVALTACDGTVVSSSAGSPCSGCEGQCVHDRCVVKLATLTGLPSALAVDETSVYWTNATAGSVMKVSKDGGTPTTLASGKGIACDNANSLAVDATRAYWMSGLTSVLGPRPPTSYLLSVPLQGGSPTTLASPTVAVDPWYGNEVDGPIALDADSAYFVYASPSRVGVVAKVPLGGGAVTTIGTTDGVSPSGLAVSGDAAFWTNTGSFGSNAGVLRVPVSSGTVSNLLVAHHPGFRAIAADSSFVYVVDTNETIQRIPRAGGTPTILASGQPVNGALAVDATSVYWAGGEDGLSHVVSVPIGGGELTTLASGTTVSGAIAVDATSVYFAESSVPKALGELVTSALMKVTPK
jgi:hypothetical protein